MSKQESKRARPKARRSDYRFFTQVPTRWGDADALGHINNALFVRYVESGRVDYFHRICEMNLSPGEPQGLVMANFEIAFVHQVHHPAALEVASRVSRLGNSSFDVECSIFMPDDEDPVIFSKAICVWFDFVAVHFHNDNLTHLDND